MHRHLLASGFGTDEVFKPRIGKANRIFRPEAGTVIIDIEYLASFATPIALHKRNPAAATEPGKIKVLGKPPSALLIHHPTRGWGVITPPQVNFWERMPVGIQIGRRVTLGELGEAQDVTNEFHWFYVESQSFPSKETGQVFAKTCQRCFSPRRTRSKRRRKTFKFRAFSTFVFFVFFVFFVVRYSLWLFVEYLHSLKAPDYPEPRENSASEEISDIV